MTEDIIRFVLTHQEHFTWVGEGPPGPGAKGHYIRSIRHNPVKHHELDERVKAYAAAFNAKEARAA